MVIEGVWDKKKTEERSRVGWSYRLCEWWKSHSEWPCLFKRSCWAVHWKNPVKCGKTLSTFVAASTECHVLDHGDKIVKRINCAANHLLDNCPSFLEKSLREWISFLAKKKFCYACLQPMKHGQNAKTGDQRLSCRSCKGKHPTAMHGYISKDKLRID